MPLCGWPVAPFARQSLESLERERPRDEDLGSFQSYPES